MKRLAIIGSREYPRLSLVREFVRHLKPTTIIVSGGARGVDAAAIGAAMEFDRPWICFPVPSWAWQLSRRAGFDRNSLIVSHADGLVAFHDGVSNGTLDALLKAEEAGLWIRVYGPLGEIVK